LEFTENRKFRQNTEKFSILFVGRIKPRILFSWLTFIRAPQPYFFTINRFNNKKNSSQNYGFTSAVVPEGHAPQMAVILVKWGRGLKGERFWGHFKGQFLKDTAFLPLPIIAQQFKTNLTEIDPKTSTTFSLCGCGWKIV
jgi:hypothetical protein